MIRAKSDQIAKAQRLLSHTKKGASTAIANAINRSAEAARTELVRSVRATYHARYGTMLAAIRIRRAHPDMKIIKATLKVYDTRRPLIQFKVTPSEPHPGGRRPIVLKVAVRKDTGMKPYPGAFVAKGKKTGLPWVLKRTSNTRYPLHIKYGPSTSELAGTVKIREAVERRAQEMLDKRLDHEIERLIGGKT